MKKSSMLNRIMSFGLALALSVASPVEIYAAEVSTVVSGETIVSNTSEGVTTTVEGESTVDATVDNAGDEKSESGASSDANQADSDVSKSEDSKSSEKVNTDDARAGSTLVKKQNDADESVDADDEADKDDVEKDDIDEDAEIEYSYTSNNDGTHTKTWIDADGEEHSEVEDCSFNEDGTCKHCGYEREEEEYSLTDEDGIVKITGTKKALNGAKKVSAKEITISTDAKQYKEMSDALDETVAAESGKSVVDFAAYDINLYDSEGNIVEPNGEVKVVFEKLSINGLDDCTCDTEVYHYVDESVNKVQDVNGASSSSVEMTTNHFSTYIIAVSNAAERCYSNDYVSVSATYYKYNRLNSANWSAISSVPEIYYSSGKPWAYIGEAWRDSFGILNVKVFVDGKRVNGDSEYVWTNNLNELYFNIAAEDGYTIKKVEMGVYSLSEKTPENSGEYKYQLTNYCQGGGPVNYLEIYLNADVTSDAQFKVDLFKYNDDNNSDNYTSWPINLAVPYSYDNREAIYMRTTSQNHDSYAVNRFYQVADGEKTYQGMPDAQLVSDSDVRYGMINFSKYRAPDYFKTSKYDPSRDTFYRDTDYVDNYGNTSDNKKSNYEEYIKAYYNVGFPIALGSDGYYEYDSQYNSATYNDETHEINIGNGSNGGFWLYGASKYHFGMHLTTDFNMTEDGQNDGKDCVFEFSGDDDVWVYVDGKLVLDLGGIHGRVAGTINFATGECTIDSKASASPARYGNGTSFNLYTDNIFNENELKDNKVHTLQMYYLERGAGDSNCKIRFNLPVINEEDEPVDPLSFTKVDAKDNTQVLPGAKFTLISSDGNYTGLDVNNNEYAVSDENGVVEFKHLKDKDGKITDGVKQGVYLLTETEAPSGYTLPATQWTVLVTSDGKGGSKFTISNSVHDSNKGYLVTNNKIETNTSVDKKASLVSWDDRTYKITLDANATTTTTTTQISNAAVNVVLVLDVSASMYFPKKLDFYKECKYYSLDKNQTYYWINADDNNYVYILKYYSRYGWRTKTADDYVTGSGSWQYADDALGYSNYKFYTSDGTTRLKNTQDAACNFIDVIADRNEKSKVAVVTFNSTGSKVIGLTELNEAGKNNLKNKINNLKASGATNQYEGLKEANKLLDEKLADKNAIILITDGIQESGSANNSIVQESHKKATTYAVGINLSYSETEKNKAETLLRNIASEEDGKELYMNIGDENLEVFLRNIADSINSTHSVGMESVITDVIDDRFELVDVDGNLITSVVATYKDNDGVNKEVTGTLTNGSIVWNVPQTNGFNATFYVKAKDDFLGGNVVTTNGAESGMKVKGESTIEKFPRPTVNVKPLDFTIEGGEEIRFLGEQIEVYNEEKAIEYLVKKVGSNSPAEIKDIKIIKGDDDSYTYSLDYRYKNTAENDVLGTITGKLTKATDEAFCDETGKATKVGSPVQTYTLTVAYTPYTVDERSAMDVNAGVVKPTDDKVAEEVKKDASYDIHVITSDLVVTKYGLSYEANAVREKLANATYGIYTLENGEYVKVEETSVTSDKDGLMVFKNLKYGTYYLKEEAAPSGYALSTKVYEIKVSRGDDSNFYEVDVQSDENAGFMNLNYSVIPEKNNKGEVVTSIKLGRESFDKIYSQVLDRTAYTLPETGGSGVYVYTIGGILLMIAGALLLYKNKKNNNK